MPMPIIGETSLYKVVQSLRELWQRRVTADIMAAPLTSIASGNLPAAAVLDITNIPASYAGLILKASGVSCDTATRQPIVQVSSDNGASFDTIAGNYKGAIFTAGTGAAVAQTLASLVESVNQAATGTWDFNVYIEGYQGGPFAKWAAFIDANGVAHYISIGQIRGLFGGALNALRIAWNGTGNFDAGTYTLWGVR